MESGEDQSREPASYQTDEGSLQLSCAYAGDEERVTCVFSRTRG